MRIFLPFLIGVLGAGSAWAQESGPYSAEVTATELRLRSGPSVAYHEVLRLTQGAKLIVIGKNANDPSWLQVELPQGYPAWVFGRYVNRTQRDKGTVTADRVLVRPTPDTTYHPLAGRLSKGDTLSILGEKKGEGGTWYRIRAPRSIPLFIHEGYVKKIGPPALAEEAAEKAAGDSGAVKATAKEAPAAMKETHAADKQVAAIAPKVKATIARGARSEELEPLKRALDEIDRNKLSSEMREQRLQLLSQVVEAQQKAAIAELKAKEKTVNESLDKRLAEIQREYRRKLAQIQSQAQQDTAPRFVTTGIVVYKPDLFGRYPSYRIEEGGKMRYFLIATQFDLAKFVGKRVGVTGLTDPESGTGYFTVMAKRIEILGDR